MMNPLYEPFPDTVRVNGVRYRIVTDFREWIKMQEFLLNVEQFTPKILQMILSWYIDEPPEDVEEAVYALQKFLMAEELYPDYGESSEEKGRTVKEVFSFSDDAFCIYSAFREVYGIDIQSVKYMHWWKFKVLFDGLPADTEIKERIYYRSVDLRDIKDKKERERIKKIKKRIAIKSKRKRVLSDYEIGAMF